LFWLPFVSSAVSVTTDLYQNISENWQLFRKFASRFRSIFNARLKLNSYRVMASVLTNDTAHFVFNVNDSLFCECKYAVIIIRFSANVNILIRFSANVSVYKAAFWG
jgi:hypothetical protein